MAGCGDDYSSRFAARHPWVSSAACGCDGERGRKCSVCRDALLCERAALVERDAVVAYLTSLGLRRLDFECVVGGALLDVAALVEEGVHLAGSAES